MMNIIDGMFIMELVFLNPLPEFLSSLFIIFANSFQPNSRPIPNVRNQTP